MDSLRRILKRWFIIIFSIFFIFAGCAFFYQDRLIYFPSPYHPLELKNFAQRGGVILEFETAQGAQQAYYFSPKEESGSEALPETIWVVTGGNGSSALDWLSYFAGYGKPDTGYLLIDYPGYGTNEGNPNPKSIREGVAAAVDAAAAHFGVDQKELASHISVLGHSLGAAIALTTAIDFGARRIVIVSPFTSMKDMASETVGSILANTILRHRYDNRKSLRTLEDKGIPVTIFHGEKDSIVPAAMGKELSDMFPGWVKYVPVPRAGHNDIFDFAGREISEAMSP